MQLKPDQQVTISLKCYWAVLHDCLEAKKSVRAQSEISQEPIVGLSLQCHKKTNKNIPIASYIRGQPRLIVNIFNKDCQQAL